MIAGEVDRMTRLGVSEWLTGRREELGETLPRPLLVKFQVASRKVPLLGLSGIDITERINQGLKEDSLFTVRWRLT